MKKDYNDAVQNKARYQGMYDQLSAAHDLVKAKLGKDDIAALSELSEEEQSIVERLGQMMAFGPNIPAVLDRCRRVAYFCTTKSYFNLIDYRVENLGDDATIILQNIMATMMSTGQIPGEDARHGTHVAGIIAAERTNGIGMNGVADNAKNHGYALF